MLFTRGDIEDGLRALVDELAAVGATSRIQVVGGAAIILRLEREVLTSDVDTLQCSTSGVQRAVERVAQAKQWPATWLNDAAQMWASHYDTDGDWEIRFSSGGVSWSRRAALDVHHDRVAEIVESDDLHIRQPDESLAD